MKSTEMSSTAPIMSNSKSLFYAGNHAETPICVQPPGQQESLEKIAQLHLEYQYTESRRKCLN